MIDVTQQPIMILSMRLLPFLIANTIGWAVKSNRNEIHNERGNPLKDRIWRPSCTIKNYNNEIIIQIIITRCCFQFFSCKKDTTTISYTEKEVISVKGMDDIYPINIGQKLNIDPLGLHPTKMPV